MFTFDYYDGSCSIVHDDDYQDDVVKHFVYMLNVWNYLFVLYDSVHQQIERQVHGINMISLMVLMTNSNFQKEKKKKNPKLL